MLADRISTVAVTGAATPLYPGGNAVDLVSVNDVKLELQITVTTDDAWLSKQITRASTAILQFINDRAQARTIYTISETAIEI